MKKRMLRIACALMTCSIMAAPTATVAFATEVSAEAEEAVPISLEDESNPVVDGSEDSDSTESNKKSSGNTPVSTTVTDDAKYIEDVDTEASDETPCHVMASLTVQEGFDKEGYIIFQNDKTGDLYRCSLLPINDFTSNIYVPEGHYSVVSVKIPAYPTLTFNEGISDSGGFTASGQDIQLNYTMDNIENVVRQDDGTYAVEEVETTDNTVIYKTPFDGITMDEDGNLYYEVTHEGTIGTMEVMGFAHGNYDMVIEIIKAGVIGEAQFRISADGGKNWYYQGTVQSVITDKSNSGLTYGFSTENDTDELQVGDTFRFSTLEIHECAIDGAGLSQARAWIVGHPTSDHELEIGVLSSGGLGLSKLQISDTVKPKTTTYTAEMPESGILDIGDGMQVYFAELAGWTRGVDITATITTYEEKATDYRPLFVLLGVVGGLIVAGFCFLATKRDKSTEYKLMEYEWKQSEDKYK